VLLVLLCASPGARAQTTVAMKPDYRDWGWDALVMENGLITLAVVPRIGARVMQYDLGQHPSIFVNAQELGKVYEPQPDSLWHNYGGYKNWPAPQERWNWPPPPILDGAPYAARVVADTPDSAAVWASSPVGRFTGQYGVFHIGTARLVLLDEGGEVVGQSAPHPVTPLEQFALDETVEVPPGATRVQVRVEGVGVLDELMRR